MVRYFFILLAMLVFSFPAFADQLIVEPDMGREPIFKAIQQANYSIDLVMYGLTDRQLLASLLQQKSKGLTVKIILEQTPYKAEGENTRAINAFHQYHIDWQGDIPRFKLIHQKTLIIDDKEAIVMTFNFTHSAFQHDRNFGLIIDNPKQVKEIANTFSADWNHQVIHHSGTDLIWSPDNSREQLSNLLSHAKESIDMYAQDIKDYRLIGSLAKAARKGIKVNILTSTNLQSKQFDYLRRAGVNIRHSEPYYIHAKVFIIDQQKAILGSINLTSASLDENRELSIITRDKSIIQQLLSVFANDWNNS